MERGPFPVQAVIIDETGENTGILEGEVRLHDKQLRFDLQGMEIGSPYETIERVSIHISPSNLDQYFDDGLVIQWTRDGNRLSAVLDVETDELYDLVSSVCAAVLLESEARVEQIITPNQIEDGSDVEKEMAATNVSINPETKAIEFSAAELEPINPNFVTVVQQGKQEDGQSIDTVVRIQTLSADETILSKLMFPSHRKQAILNDYVKAAYQLSETGGPIEVLLVDDEPGVVESAKIHLKDEHEALSISTATRTEQAVAMIEKRDFECIVCDFVMPGGGAPTIIDSFKKYGSPGALIIFSRKDPDMLPDEDIPSGIDLWITKEAEVDQYHRLGYTVKRLVAANRTQQCAMGDEATQ